MHHRKLLAISFLSIPLSAGNALVPVLSNLAAAFPRQEQWIQLLITVPSLFMMFSSIFTDKLSNYISLKAITIISILIIFVSGISPYWSSYFPYLLFTRVCMGIGLGLLNTVISSLPALYFDENEARDSAVGIQSAFVCAGGILFHLFSGIAAKYNWKYVFLIQLLNLIPLIAAMFFMPHTEIKKVPSSNYPRRSIYVKSALPIAVISFITIILTCTYPLNLSLFVEKSGLGNSQFTGLITSVNSAIGFFIGLIFGKVYAKMKEKTLPLGLTITALSMLAIRFSMNQTVLFAASICFGIGTSFISPTLYSILYHKVKPEEIVSSVALLGISVNVSQFLSPFFINPIAKAITPTQVEGTRILVSSMLLLILTLIIALKYRKNKGVHNE